MSRYAMIAIFNISLLIVSAGVFLLAAFLFLEVVGAIAPLRRTHRGGQAPGPVAIVIPAHNEAASIGATLAAVLAQHREGDRVIVVADNCTDDTAARAAAAGAECWERNDPSRRGKGYALQFALDRLKDDPPETVVFIDADCIASADGLLRLAGAAQETKRPVQALHLMQAPAGAGPRLKVAAFAWLFLNHVRMRGLDRLFSVSRITGAGIALPWPIAGALDMASGEIVEDLALTLALTRQKNPPLFFPETLVTSEFPTAEEALAKQRARWEHGSQRLALKTAAPNFFLGLREGDARLSAIAADMMIPPVANLLMLILAVFALGLLGLVFGTT
ncbi:MAG: glycosyltransferase family 2 protein, partial [Hyphococcus sp.]